MKRSTFVFLLRWLSDRNINDLENGAERLEHEGKETSFCSDPRAALGALFQVNLEHFYGPVIYDWPTGTVLMVAVGAGPATELGPRLITGTRVWSFKSSASPKKCGRHWNRR